MKNLTVLVDMDDTIEGLLPAWVEYLNSHHGTTVDVNDITDWEIPLFFPTLTKEQVFAPLHSDEGFWATVKPLDGAAEYIQKLMDDGHKVLVVTTSDYRSLRPKMDDVLFKNFPMFKWGDVIITAHKQLVNGDVLVDDGIHNLVGGSYEKLLMDSPHNRSYDAEANGMKRVMNWGETYNAICEIAQR